MCAARSATAISTSMGFGARGHDGGGAGRGGGVVIGDATHGTLVEAKRLLARQASDPAVVAAAALSPYTLAHSETGHPLYETAHGGTLRRYPPEYVLGAVLARLRAMAEAQLGVCVTEAVIVTPTVWSHAQLLALEDAASLAGVTVVRQVSETTAVALHDMFTQWREDSGEVLTAVVTVGAGWCNAAVVTVEDHVVEVKSVASAMVGGADLVRRLMRHCLTAFVTRHGGVDASGSVRAMKRLRTACECALRTLCAASSVTVDVDALHSERDLSVVVTREQLSALCAEDVATMGGVVETALRLARVAPAAIQRLLVTGGCSRLPQVQAAVRSAVGGREPVRGMDVETSAVLGCAVMAAAMSRACTARGTRGKLDEMLCLEATPTSLGVETGGGVFTRLVPRNTTYPTRKCHTFTTHTDGQTAMLVRVFEGEGAMCRDCTLVGEMRLDGVPAAARGTVEVEVTMDMDGSRTTWVRAEVKGSGGGGASKAMLLSCERTRLTVVDVERLSAEARLLATECEAVRAANASRVALEARSFAARAAAARLPVESARAAVMRAAEATLRWLEREGEGADVATLVVQWGALERTLAPHCEAM